MLSNDGMDIIFWDEASSTAWYFINRSPCILLHRKTSIKIWSSLPANYSLFKVSSCTAYAHVDNIKLEHRDVKCVFFDYGSGVKTFKLWNPKTKRVLMSGNVVFNEVVMFYHSTSTYFWCYW
jgi:hypothetical protein